MGNLKRFWNKCKKSNLAVWLPYALFGLMAAMFLWRSFYGFDWSNETAYLAVPCRFLMGDKILIDSWDRHQSFAMLIMPLLFFYKQVVGSFDGCILFMRILFLVFQTVSVFFIYRFLFRFSHSHITAMLSGCLIFAFLPTNICNFSYNSVPLLQMIISGSALMSLYGFGTKKPSVFRALTAGIFSGLAVAGFPMYCFAVLPMFFLLILIRPFPKKNNRVFSRFLPAILFSVGVFVVLASVGIIIGLWIGFSELRHNISMLITIPECPVSGYLKAIRRFVQVYVKQDVFFLLEASLLAMIFLYRKVSFPVPFKLEVIFDVVIKASLPFCILANAILILTTPNWQLPIIAKVTRLQTCAGIWPVILCAQHPSKRSKITLMGLFFPGQLMAMGSYLADRSSGFGAAFALLPCMTAAIIIIYENYGPLLRGAHTVKHESAIAVLQTCMAMLAFFVVGTTMFFRMNAVYRDMPLPQLDTVMKTGPAKGIHTSKSNASNYEHIVAEIKNSVPQNGKVLFIGYLPFGYICADKEVASPTVEGTSVSDAKLWYYLQRNPLRRPNWIYTPKSPYGYSNVSNGPNLRRAQWLADGPLNARETAYSYLYQSVITDNPNYYLATKK